MDNHKGLRYEDGSFSTWEARFASHKAEVAETIDKLREQSIASGVKLDKLYGSEGQPGAVDKLTERVDALGNKIVYASGFLAAVVMLVGWYISIHGK